MVATNPSPQPPPLCGEGEFGSVDHVSLSDPYSHPSLGEGLGKRLSTARGANQVLSSLLPPVLFLSRGQAKADWRNTEDFEFGAAIGALDDLANDGIGQFNIGGAFRTSVHLFLPSLKSMCFVYQLSVGAG
jgi:hypothetical protein